LADDSPLKRNRGGAGDFAVSSLFNCLTVLLFRIGETAAHRAGDGSSKLADGGRKRTWRDLGGPKDILPEF
jgi:hypothetical protein